MEKTVKTVTFGVIAYNEHQYIPDILEDLLNQTYDKRLIEVILVDGESDDDTWQIMEIFKEDYKNLFLDIKTYKNPKRIQPAGWNIVLLNSTADVLLRIDAHARLPKQFVEKNVECINNGEDVCGGPRENIIDENTLWKKMLLDAEKSMFGAGIATYRNETDEKKYVKSVFHGCYKRDVLKTVGMFNEKLIRTEDNEYHYRIRQHGYRICYDPEIKSYYQTRNSLKGMLKQKYQNGLWIGKTMFECPGCISIFHLVPFAFVVSLIISIALFCFNIKHFLIIEVALYLLFLLWNATVLLLKNKNPMDLFLPIVIFLIHCSYGIGTASGFVSTLARKLAMKSHV